MTASVVFLELLVRSVSDVFAELASERFLISMAAHMIIVAGFCIQNEIAFFAFVTLSYGDIRLLTWWRFDQRLSTAGGSYGDRFGFRVF